MSSDSESSTEALLLGTSTGLSNNNKPPRPSVNVNSDDDDEDQMLRRAMEASQATFALETRRRQSSLSTSNLPPPPRKQHSKASSDDDDELDVLQPRSSSKMAAVAVAVAPEKPRLTYSGAAPADPVALDDDDDDDSGIESDNGIRASSDLDVKPRAKPSAEEPVALDDDSGVDDDDDDDDDDGIHASSDLDMKPHAKPSVTRRPLVSGSRQAASAAWNDNDRPSPPPAARPAKTGPLQKSTSSDDDSDDSLASLLKPLKSKRKKHETYSSSSDSDDSDLPIKKKPTKKRPSTASTESRQSATAAAKQKAAQAKRAAAQAKKEERAAKKRQDEEAKQARQRERTAKKAAADAVKESRKRHRVQAAQARGKHAAQEICVLADGSLMHHPVLPVVSELQADNKYLVHEYASGLDCCALQFIRKDFVQGGAQDAYQKLLRRKEEEYQHLPVMAIVFDVPHEFIDMLTRNNHDDDEDYPVLERWLRGVEAGWRAAWRYPSNRRPRIILVLHNVMEALDKMWVNHRHSNAAAASRRTETHNLPTAEELHDAVTWMLIQFQVECVFCSSTEELTNHVKKMTRMLSEEPYQRVVTELECIKKLKPHVSDCAEPYERAVDCWMRQVQQIPRVSLQAAGVLTEYYPTARTLWRAYQNDDLTEAEKQGLLADCLSRSRSQFKLSAWVYRVMTSEDPKELLR